MITYGRGDGQTPAHWVNLLRQTSLRAPWQPSTRLAHARPGIHIRSPRLRLRLAQPHVRLGLPRRSRLVWLATCPSARGQIDLLPTGLFTSALDPERVWWAHG